MTNIFACLVHESRESVVDLARNLTYLDPDSRILLYDGGRDPSLLRRPLVVAGREPLVHPAPQPLVWGALHEFAVDCMRFALEETAFDTLTIVDSDQLLLRPGYSAALAAFLDAHPSAGLLGNAPRVQPPTTSVAPAQAAWREHALWMPYCRRFEQGEAKFPYWTFWPSTVFSAAACRDLVATFEGDEELARVLASSRLWATEEIVLPTLVALHGHEIARSPFRYDVVRYRVRATPEEARAALRRPDVFWIHPVPRRVEDPLRALVRRHHAHYRRAASPPSEREPLLLTLPILERMRAVAGPLEDDEADLLIAGLARALAELPEPHHIVAVEQPAGRATIVLKSVVEALAARADVRAPRADVRPVSFLFVDAPPGAAAPALHTLEPDLADGAYVALRSGGLHPDDGYRPVGAAGTLTLLQRAAGVRAREPAGPLVSCVMPTYDRPQLARHAVASLLRQSYADVELVVVDDGEESLAALLPGDARVRHVRLERREPIGTKRNAGCEAARGDLIANWDDDDWYAPWRIEYQVARLLEGGAEICGLDRLLFFAPHERRAWRYAWPASARPWLHDAVLLFTRDFWRRNPFPDSSFAVDCGLLWTPSSKRLLALDDERFFVGMLHGRNTSPKHRGERLWHAYPPEEIERLIGADAAFYRDALVASR